MEAQKTFRYTGSIHLYKIVSKIIGFIGLLFMLALLIIALFNSTGRFPVGGYVIIGLASLILVFGIIAGTSFWPDIQIDDEGLLVEFFPKPLRVSWNQVRSVQQVHMIMLSNKFWLVKTDALTPFHRFYSLAYSGSLEPSFLISSRMKGHEILMAELRQSHRKANKLLHKQS